MLPLLQSLPHCISGRRYSAHHWRLPGWIRLPLVLLGDDRLHELARWRQTLRQLRATHRAAFVGLGTTPLETSEMETMTARQNNRLHGYGLERHRKERTIPGNLLGFALKNRLSKRRVEANAATFVLFLLVRPSRPGARPAKRQTAEKVHVSTKSRSGSLAEQSMDKPRTKSVIHEKYWYNPRKIYWYNPRPRKYNFVFVFSSFQPHAKRRRI